jgi:hypothetical protein
MTRASPSGIDEADAPASESMVAAGIHWLALRA